MVSKLKCPGCGALFSPSDSSLSQTYHASSACESQYHELSAWLWSKDAESFPKQYAVDAYGAQHVGPATKDIRVAFSLIGLYLAVEKGYTGKMVQEAHQKLAQKKIVWPHFGAPATPYTVTVVDVLKRTSPQDRLLALNAWSADVWRNWGAEKQAWTRALCQRYLF